MDDFYIIKFAYHCFEFFNASLFHRTRRDFSEFLLHHIMTMVLISYSYYSNFLPIGMVIMFIMDFSDIFIATFKLVVDISEVGQFIMFWVMAISWFWLRIYYFPMR